MTVKRVVSMKVREKLLQALFSLCHCRRLAEPSESWVHSLQMEEDVDFAPQRMDFTTRDVNM